MRRNNNMQQNPINNSNNVNNNRGKSNNPMNNNHMNNNANSNNLNLNRNPSSNKFGNNNANQRNNTSVTNKNFKNLKGNDKSGIPNSAVISDKNYAIFKNQDYFNLDNFNYYGNPNQNNSNNNGNAEYSSNNFNNNNINNYQRNNNNNNQRASQINDNYNNASINFSDPIRNNNNKPNTTTVKSQIHFDDYTNNNDGNLAKGKKHFVNNQISNNNAKLNQGNTYVPNNNNNNNNFNNNNSNLNRNNQNNFDNSNPNIRGKSNSNGNNNQNQNNAHSKTILLKIKAAKTNGIINISNMNLNSLPKEIFDDTVRFDDINWWELVDIKKIDATNNQIDETFNNENISFQAIPNLSYLKFSGNNFTAIPDSIYSLYALKFLDFSDNKLRNISDNIRGLKSLVDLNLSNNAISAIPNEIGKLTELEIMNVSQNKLNMIPQGIGNIMKLKRLDLSNNFLDCIPTYIGALYNLEELVLFKNKIKQIQGNSLSKLCNLKYLDLHNNNLDCFTEIPKSDKLDTLILGYNKIEAIDNLRNCPNLTVLDVNNNKLENFPEDVLNLKNIITLNLMNNSINDIPPALCYLNKLVRLNIEGNPLRKINSKLRSSNAEQIKNYLKTRIVDNEENDFPSPQQPNLRNNNADENNEFDKSENNNNQNNYSNQRDNSYSSMPSKESNINLLNYYQNNYLKIMNLDIERIPVDNFKKFKIFNCVGLDLSNNKVKDLSFYEQLPVFHDLQEFKVNFNKLTNVNPSIINFKNLRILEIKNNLLTEFFDNINLQVYENSNNENMLKANTKPIDSINSNKKNSNNFYDRNSSNNLFKQDDVSKEDDNKPFPNLEYLDLSNNKLRNFPLIIKFCTKLNTILLSNNTITNVDCLKEIKNPNLFTLEMGTNKISALPEKLYQNIPNIKHLGLENNDLKMVPTDLCFMKNLNKITLSGNPIKLLRPNILSGGTKTILEYLRKMHRFTDEELIMEGEKSNFFNFNNVPVEKSSNKRGMYKNEQSPMDMDNDFNQAMSPKQRNKGKFNPSSNPNIVSNLNNDVKEFGDVEMEIENNNMNMNRNLISANQVQEPLINHQNNLAPENNFNSQHEELDEVNRQILIVESEMGEGNMPMFKKTDLRKKLNELIRRRANIMKNLDN